MSHPTDLTDTLTPEAISAELWAQYQQLSHLRIHRFGKLMDVQMQIYEAIQTMLPVLSLQETVVLIKTQKAMLEILERLETHVQKELQTELQPELQSEAIDTVLAVPPESPKPTLRLVQ